MTATAPNAAIFDPMTLKKGDTVGSFVVVAVGPAKEGHTLSANDASVRFTMNVSIKGTYRVVNGYDVVDPLSPEVAKMLPHQANDPLELQSSTCIEYPAIKNLNLHEGDAVVGVAKEVAYVSYPSSGCRYTMSLQSLEKAKN